MTKEEFQKKLEELIDAAVSEGRQNWDGYYGHDNDFHIRNLRESPLYKELINVIPAN